MDQSELASATSWLHWLSAVKYIGGVMVVAGVAAEVLGDWFSEPYQKKLEDARKLEITRLTTEGERLSKEAATARADIAKANADTAKAQQATEEVRRQNLELEQALSPRSLGFKFDELKELADMGRVRWAIRASAREEPQDTAQQFVFMLGSIPTWERLPEIPFDPLGMDEVTIWFSERSLQPIADALAAIAGRSFEVRAMLLPGARQQAIGPGAILIEVGVRKPPAVARSIREGRAKALKDAEEAAAAARARFGLPPNPAK